MELHFLFLGEEMGSSGVELSPSCPMNLTMKLLCILVVAKLLNNWGLAIVRMFFDGSK